MCWGGPQHIVDQLDVLTQTMTLMEERLTMNEDKVGRIASAVVALQSQTPVPDESTD